MTEVALIVSGIIGAVVLIALFDVIRCFIGWHPAQSIRMKSGMRDVQRRDVSVTEWECLRCSRIIATRRVQLSVKTLKNLRSQVGASRERSKVIHLHVVKGRYG